MKANFFIKYFFLLIFIFISQIVHSKIIINDDILIDIPNQWIHVSSDEINNLTSTAQEYGLNSKFSKNFIGRWNLNKVRTVEDLSNVLFFRYRNSGNTLYRNYLIKENRNIARNYLKEMSEEFNKLSNFSMFIENQKFHFNKNRDMLTADFKSTISFYSGTTVDSLSCDTLFVFIYTQSHMYMLQAYFYYDSYFNHNKAEFENFLTNIYISEDSKIKDDRENIFQRIGTHLKNIYAFIITDEGKEFFLYLILFFFTVIFFKTMSERNPRNLLYKYTYNILNILFKIILRAIFRQPYSNTHADNSSVISQTSEVESPPDEADLLNNTDNTEFDDGLSGNFENDDYLSTASELDDSISNQQLDDEISEKFNLDDSTSKKKLK